MKRFLATLRARVQTLATARKYARAHKATITVAVIAALHILSMAGVHLPARDIEHAVSALVG